MRALRRLIRKIKWRLEFFWHYVLPNWEDTWDPIARRWRHIRIDLKDWYAGRDFRRLWLGLPALLACALWLVFAVLLLIRTGGRTEAKYTQAAKQAMYAQRYEEAGLAYERLLQMDKKPDPDHIFGLTSTLLARGQGDEAMALLASIAPLNGAGYAPAHLMLARIILATAASSPGVLPGAESHLKSVLQLEPRNLEVRVMLGTLYMQTGQWALAREHLQKAYPNRKEAALLLAGVAAGQGDVPETRKWALEAQSVYKAEVTAKPGEGLERMRWAQATLLLGQFAEALDILKPGFTQPEKKAYYDAAAQVYVQWTRKVRQESPRDSATRLGLIQRGLEYAPNDRELLLQLIELSRLSGQESEAARERIKGLLASGKDAAILHFYLGGDAWQRGRTEEARQHFLLAYDLAPNMPYVANNTAMMLATGNPPDLPRALAIIQPLADKLPNNPYVQDTRGQILIKMGKWQEGVKCLELALPSLTDKAKTHQALAEAYQHLGMKDMAAEHQKLARQKPPQN